MYGYIYIYVYIYYIFVWIYIYIHMMYMQSGWRTTVCARYLSRQQVDQAMLFCPWLIWCHFLIFVVPQCMRRSGRSTNEQISKMRESTNASKMCVDMGGTQSMLTIAPKLGIVGVGLHCLIQISTWNQLVAVGWCLSHIIDTEQEDPSRRVAKKRMSIYLPAFVELAIDIQRDDIYIDSNYLDI
jgi:hypothetical protein